jgi:hypothetical protein
VKLGRATRTLSLKSNNRSGGGGGGTGRQQNYLKSWNKRRKFSMSMNSLFDKATSNLAHIVKVSSKRSSTLTYYNASASQQYHQQPHYKRNSRLVDTGVQTTSSLLFNSLLQSSHNAADDNKQPVSELSNSNTSSSFNSHATQLIQTNPFGSIVANFGSASIMQRSHTARLLDKEKKSKLSRLRTYSDYNVLSLSASPSTGSKSGRSNKTNRNSSFEPPVQKVLSSSASSSPTGASTLSTSPSHPPPAYHNSVSSSKLIQLNLLI